MEKYYGLENVIRQAIADAWAEGMDYTGQPGRAVRMIQSVAHDMGASGAMHLVRLYRAENEKPRDMEARLVLELRR